jgi:hypothetical protein
LILQALRRLAKYRPADAVKNIDGAFVLERNDRADVAKSIANSSLTVASFARHTGVASCARLHPWRAQVTAKTHAGGPDFLGIGAARSGTTWLAENLRRNPEI